RYLFTTGTAWGRAGIDDDSLELTVDGGTLEVQRLELRGVRAGGPVRLAAGDCFTASIIDPPRQENPA
ncbi:MAG: hypothetical protein U1E32_12875, partial [Rhodoglobus sp.]|nr:hypothetical protein [Rhodoglobus sp.]